jgi:hypothetical protein
MKEGRIYIASVFDNLDPFNGQGVDNDPHFWYTPPTWGICRTDFRSNVKKDDVVFFVSSKNNSNFPQMIFAYLVVSRTITHDQAFIEFPDKRMRSNAVVPGNILVDSRGKYNKADEGAHLDRFHEIKNHYVVGQKYSRMLTIDEINRKAPELDMIINRIFDKKYMKAHEIIGQKGRVLNEKQINKLIDWLNG